MHVVRTIGQAFEVCHKINQERTDDDKTKKTGDPGAITPVETPIDADEKSELATSLCIAWECDIYVAFLICLFTFTFLDGQIIVGQKWRIFFEVTKYFTL